MDEPTEAGSAEARPAAGSAEAEYRQRRGFSFGTAAAAYAEHRPDYAEAAVGWAVAPVRSRQPLRVVDLGAGTGKLTATLAGIGADVTAVEPDGEMLAQLRHELPSVRALPGRAEEIPLPDGSADAVVAGEAMHWFDLDRAMPEIGRVLTPGGVLAGLWNVDDDRVGWVAGLTAVGKGDTDATLTNWRASTAQVRQERLLTAGAGLFHDAQAAEFEHGQLRTADSLLATIATHSRLLVMDEPERARLLARIREFLRTQPETANGTFVLPMATAVLRMRRT